MSDSSLSLDVHPSILVNWEPLNVRGMDLNRLVSSFAAQTIFIVETETKSSSSAQGLAASPLILFICEFMIIFIWNVINFI